MKIRRILAMALAMCALAMTSVSARADWVSWTGTNGLGDSVNMGFHVTGNLIDSITGTVITVSTGGPLSITSLMNPMTESGFPWIFDNLWNPGFDNDGIAFNFGPGLQSNIYTVGSQVLFSVYGFGDPVYNPGHVLTTVDFVTRNDVSEPATLALVGLAVLGLGASSRRRSTANKPSVPLVPRLYLRMKH